MEMTTKKRKQYVQALQMNKLLKGLPEYRLQNMLNELEEETWAKHTCRVDREKSLFHFYFILSGRLKVYKVDNATGREFTLFILTKNDVFDLLCLLDEEEHPVYYETLDKVVLLCVTMDKMRQWVQENPEINRNMLPYLAQQLKTMEEYASNVTLIDISTRLAKLILTHINSESKKLEMINDLSNEELANLIGSTRAVVNRHLQDFKNDGILSLGRQKVEIKNLQLLLERANISSQKNHNTAADDLTEK
jgi:CRP/FNR family cyclic AMP-dependent transcriptional regulator